jgi:pyruvate/2-oxoglutarate dehydrogenase complex dihydrolipoamide acyltransferase (E2) component
MRYIFKFPDIGEGIAEGKILTWYVKRGQAIKAGDPVVKMETDKVVTDIPSPRAGVVASVFGNEGDVINVGDPLVEIEIEGVEGEAAREAAAEKPMRRGSAWSGRSKWRVMRRISRRGRKVSRHGRPLRKHRRERHLPPRWPVQWPGTWESISIRYGEPDRRDV